jgi:hypothetical protein
LKALEVLPVFEAEGLDAGGRASSAGGLEEGWVGDAAEAAGAAREGDEVRAAGWAGVESVDGVVLEGPAEDDEAAAAF